MAVNGVWTTSVKSSGRRYFEAPIQCRRRRICSVRSLSASSFWIITSNCLSTSSSSQFSAGAFNSSQLQPQLVSHVLSCFPPPSSSSPKKTAVNLSPKLYVSGLSFRTTEQSLRNAFLNFGQLIEVNLVMDRIANRPRGFAFLRYATEEESKKAIEGMHGKFLDGRVIFVEVAKPRSQLRQSSQQHSN